MTIPAPERFWPKVDVRGEDECWLWTAGTNGCGYGQFFKSPSQRHVLSHRFVYELLIGPVPEGLVLDHLCGQTLCVNPAHLKAVTNRENCSRGDHRVNSFHSRKTHCRNGHLYSEDNTSRTREGHRVCKTCRRAQSLAAYYRAKKLRVYPAQCR